MRFWALVLLLLVMTACSQVLTTPCPEGTRDSGIGGTGQCEPAPED